MKRSAPDDISDDGEIAKRQDADDSAPSTSLGASAESAEKPTMAHEAASADAVAETVDINKYKIFVGGIDPRVTTQELTQYFETFGRTVDCIVMQDRATGRPRGFGYAHMALSHTRAIVPRLLSTLWRNLKHAAHPSAYIYSFKVVVRMLIGL